MARIWGRRPPIARRQGWGDGGNLPGPADPDPPDHRVISPGNTAIEAGALSFIREGSRCGLAQMPARPNARVYVIRRQVDVPAIGKFEIARNDPPGATLDDVSRTIREMVGETIDLAHDSLA